MDFPTHDEESKRNTKTWISLAIAQTLWAGSALAAPDTTANNVSQWMEAAAAHMATVGPEHALRDFAEPSGKWQQGGYGKRQGNQVFAPTSGQGLVSWQSTISGHSGAEG